MNFYNCSRICRTGAALCTRPRCHPAAAAAAAPAQYNGVERNPAAARLRKSTCTKMKIFHSPMKKEEEEEKRVGVKGREREGVECGCVRVGARERESV